MASFSNAYFNFGTDWWLVWNPSCQFFRASTSSLSAHITFGPWPLSVFRAGANTNIVKITPIITKTLRGWSVKKRARDPWLSWDCHAVVCDSEKGPQLLQPSFIQNGFCELRSPQQVRAGCTLPVFEVSTRRLKLNFTVVSSLAMTKTSSSLIGASGEGFFSYKRTNIWISPLLL